MKKVAVISNIRNEGDSQSIYTIADIIKSHGIELMLPLRFKDSGIDAAYTKIEDFKSADMIIVLGGDGSLLAAAKDFFDDDVPILGINFGHLGFLTELEKNDTETLHEILSGNYVTSKHMTLSVKVGDKTYKALNDATIHRGEASRMLHISIFVGEQIINSFRADGVIISTPTGSTAYSLSAGGPIVDPVVNVLLITPICPHNLYSRSIIIPADKEIIVKVKSGESSGILTLDGQSGLKVANGEELRFIGDGSVNLIRKSTNSFYDKLQRKMFEKDG